MVWDRYSRAMIFSNRPSCIPVADPLWHMQGAFPVLYQLSQAFFNLLGWILWSWMLIVRCICIKKWLKQLKGPCILQSINKEMKNHLKLTQKLSYSNPSFFKTNLPFTMERMSLMSLLNQAKGSMGLNLGCCCRLSLIHCSKRILVLIHATFTSTLGF